MRGPRCVRGDGAMNDTPDIIFGFPPDFGHWFAGLVDGEGSFNILSHNCGVYCCFSLAFRIDDLPTLEYIQKMLGYGRIHVDRKKYDKTRNSNPAVRFVVADSRGLSNLVQLFQVYPLRSKKLSDFLIWSEAVEIYSSLRTYKVKRVRGENKIWRDQQLTGIKKRLELQRKYAA